MWRLAFVLLAACGTEITEKANELSGSDNCQEVATCNAYVHVDCGSEVDGPTYYFRRYTGELIATCSAWPVPGQMCPPPEWSCER